MTPMTRQERDSLEFVLDHVAAERMNQHQKWGNQDHKSNHNFGMILMEEVGEAAKDVNDRSPVSLYNETIQVAAVAVAWASAQLTKEGAPWKAEESIWKAKQ